MFKWFAPLLLFAGKPEVLLRLVVAAIAGAVLFFGVWLISNIAVTFDTLKNPAIAAIYAAVLFLFFVIVGTVSWLRLRRLAAPAKKLSPRPAPEVPLPAEMVARRSKELTGQWQEESRRAARRPEPRASVSKPTPEPAKPAAPPPQKQTSHPTLLVT